MAFDPNFPHRPQHPDFDRLSKIVCATDEATTADSIDELVSSIIDPGSIAYMCHQRVMRAVTLVPTDTLGGLGAVWLDAFVAGAMFAQSKADEAK